LSVYEADRAAFDIGLRRALNRAYLKRNPDAAAIAASVVAAGALGLALSLSPILGASLVAFVALLAVIAIFDLLGVAVILAATVPWLIVLSAVLPRLTLTFVAGATALVTLLVVRPRGDGSKASFLLRLGMVLFFAPAAISLGRSGTADGFIQAAKYVVFPVMVLAVTEATNRRDLFRLRTVALWSGLVAITVNLILGFAGVTKSEYYESGEILGFGGEHVLALLAGCLTAASLASGLTLSWAPVIAVGAIATVATGVRSALPGLALVAIARMITGRLRFRMMVLVALAVVGIFASGAADVVENRYHRGKSLGEYNSFSSFGSGRGTVYQVAVESWWNSSPIDLVIGTGLRSIRTFQEERTGVANVGHSDIIEVGVQLGVVGLIGLLLIWRVLIERVESRLPLFVLGSFALFNGMLEYSGAVVVALVLTAGLKSRQPVPPEEPLGVRAHPLISRRA
jgi:hypothetical protein